MGGGRGGGGEGVNHGSPKMSSRRDLKNWYEAEGAKGYREANKRIQEDSEEKKGGLDRYSVQGDRNLSE